jgi:hypothetical protein
LRGQFEREGAQNDVLAGWEGVHDGGESCKVGGVHGDCPGQRPSKASVAEEQIQLGSDRTGLGDGLAAEVLEVVTYHPANRGCEAGMVGSGPGQQVERMNAGRGVAAEHTGHHGRVFTPGRRDESLSHEIGLDRLPPPRTGVEAVRPAGELPPALLASVHEVGDKAQEPSRFVFARSAGEGREGDHPAPQLPSCGHRGGCSVLLPVPVLVVHHRVEEVRPIGGHRGRVAGREVRGDDDQQRIRERVMAQVNSPKWIIRRHRVLAEVGSKALGSGSVQVGAFGRRERCVGQDVEGCVIGHCRQRVALVEHTDVIARPVRRRGAHQQHNTDRMLLRRRHREPR